MVLQGKAEFFEVVGNTENIALFWYICKHFVHFFSIKNTDRQDLNDLFVEMQIIFKDIFLIAMAPPSPVKHAVKITDFIVRQFERFLFESEDRKC